MAQKKWEIEFYGKIGGRCPIQEFLDSLSGKDRVFVDNAMERLEIYGNELDAHYIKPLRDKIWELRVDIINNRCRILFFFDKQVVVFTHGFVKKSGPVRDFEIDKAVEVRNDYFKRKG